MRREACGSGSVEPVALLAVETAVRDRDVLSQADPSVALADSHAFARAYAAVIERYYTVADAGRDE